MRERRKEREGGYGRERKEREEGNRGREKTRS